MVQTTHKRDHARAVLRCPIQLLLGLSTSCRQLLTFLLELRWSVFGFNGTPPPREHLKNGRPGLKPRTNMCTREDKRYCTTVVAPFTFTLSRLAWKPAQPGRHRVPPPKIPAFGLHGIAICAVVVQSTELLPCGNMSYENGARPVFALLENPCWRPLPRPARALAMSPY